MHIVNEASVKLLKEQYLAAYEGTEEEINDFDAEMFRPNIVIDSKVPYSEDEFFEARINNILVR